MKFRIEAFDILNHPNFQQRTVDNVQGLASLVTTSRIKGKQHFPSDVFVVSILGNMVAQNVYTRHHDPDLGGEAWHSIGEIVRGDRDLSRSSMGSPYVPLDSWIYEALDRLAGLGVMDSGFVGLRPWTRMECARLVNEAADHTNGGDGTGQASRFVEQLQREFQYEISDLEGDSNWEITFGRQSLWWGPGDGGPMILSDNAQPMNMFRVARTTPLKLPSFLGWLGPIRTEFFLGQLQGYNFVFSSNGFVGEFNRGLTPEPFIHGEKLSFKPTRNFEFGFLRTTVYGGPGYPLTIHTLLRSLFSTTNERITDSGGSPVKPGDRRSGVDFSYRLPGLRNWLTVYGDGFTDDQFSPVAYADRSAWHAGLYLSQVPLVPKLDLRVEGVYTDVPAGGQIGHGFYYFNLTWRSGYTNDGSLIGSWIGKEGQGAQAWTNYARDRLQFNYRHRKVSQEYIPGGGTLTDVEARGDYWFRSNMSVTASVQYERWLFPVIQPNAQRDVTASVGVQFQPKKLFRPSGADMSEHLPGMEGKP